MSESGSGDYKYDIQLIAEELAKRDYGKDFYQCTPDQQYQLFLAATESWREEQLAHGDYLRKAARENAL